MADSGKAKCSILHECLREICYLAAIFEFEIRLQHLDSQSNHIADHMSRWHFSKKHQSSFYEQTKDFSLNEGTVDDS